MNYTKNMIIMAVQEIRMEKYDKIIHKIIFKCKYDFFILFSNTMKYIPCGLI